MCWYSKKISKPNVAENDIFVYKIVLPYFNASVMSYYKEHIYHIGKTYSKNKECLKQVFCAVHDAFHSYSLKNTSLFLNKTSFCVNDKYKHSLDYWFRDRNDLLFALCIIPKGAYYKENESGEIVSNEIKIIRRYNIINNIKDISQFVKYELYP